MRFEFNSQPDGERKTREGDQDGRETMMREAAEGGDTSRRSIQTMIEDPSMVTITQDHRQGTETFRTYSQSPYPTSFAKFDSFQCLDDNLLVQDWFHKSQYVVHVKP